jgi:hypothetical protein
LTSWADRTVEAHAGADQELADAAALQHRVGDQLRLGAVVTGLDQSLQLSPLHPAPHIGVISKTLSSWY